MNWYEQVLSTGDIDTIVNLDIEDMQSLSWLQDSNKLYALEAKRIQDEALSQDRDLTHDEMLSMLGFEISSLKINKKLEQLRQTINSPTGNWYGILKQEYGLTDDPSEAGYLLTDGSFLDLSGKNQGGSAGIRAFDHREVTGHLDGMSSGTKGMREFEEMSGSIRWHYTYNDVLDIEMASAPTDQQIREIMNHAKDLQYFGIDVVNGSGKKFFHFTKDFPRRGDILKILNQAIKALS